MAQSACIECGKITSEDAKLCSACGCKFPTAAAQRRQKLNHFYAVVAFGTVSVLVFNTGGVFHIPLVRFMGSCFLAMSVVFLIVTVAALFMPKFRAT